MLARFLVDDPDDEECVGQRPAAVAALSERAHVSATVLLELEWVMRGFYELPRGDCLVALRALLGIAHLTIEDRDAVLTALDAFADGMDFADALHLARSRHASAFVTFDRSLARRAARRAAMLPVQLLRQSSGA